MSDGYHAIDATQSQQGHWTERKLEEGVVQIAAAVLVRPDECQRRERPADDGVERDLGDDGARLCGNQFRTPHADGVESTDLFPHRAHAIVCQALRPIAVTNDSTPTKKLSRTAIHSRSKYRLMKFSTLVSLSYGRDRRSSATVDTTITWSWQTSELIIKAA